MSLLDVFCCEVPLVVSGFSGLDVAGVCLVLIIAEVFEVGVFVRFFPETRVFDDALFDVFGIDVVCVDLVSFGETGGFDDVEGFFVF